MKPRLDYYKAAPAAAQAVLALENYVQKCGLEPSLINLVKLRASQINGCAYCVHMHSREARAKGESEDRLQLLVVWHESPLYTDRERAALAWTDALTRLSETHAPDDVYEELKPHFSEEEIVKLTTVIGAINVWNRFGVGFRLVHPVESAKMAAAH